MAQDWFDVNAPETPQRGPGSGSTTFDYTGATGMPPAGGFTWPNGTPPPVIHPGDKAADVPGLPHGSAPGGTTAGGGTTTTDPAGEFAQYLSRHPGDPQAAIDEWIAAGDHGGLKPKYYDNNKTIGLANGTYLVAPGTGGNSGAGWQTVQRTEGAGNGAFSFPSWNENFSYAPWDKTFTAPDGITEQNDPGYKDRMALGADAIQRSALAQGTGLTGGTLRDLEQFGQTFGSTEYGNVYSRALNDYNTALDAYRLNYNTAAQQYNQRYGQYGDAYNRAYQTYMGNFGVSNTLNQEGFANSLSLAQLGLTGALGTTQAAGQYGAGATNTILGIGNTQAAGQVGGANATTNGLAGITNIVNGTLSSYNRNRQPPNQQGYPGQYGGF